MSESGSIRVSLRIPDEIDLLVSEAGVDLAKATGDAEWNRNRTMRLIYLIQRGLVERGYLTPEDAEIPPNRKES